MPFKRFVETGRVALVSDGINKGKLVSIVNVIDQTRVLVDGPASKVPRQEIRLNQLHLTKFRLKFPFSASTRVVRKTWETAKVDDQWKESMWAKKLEAKKKRGAMSDFDRFKLRKARQRRNKIRTQAFFQIKKRSSRDGTLFGKKYISKSKGKPRTKPGDKAAKPVKAAPTKPAATKEAKTPAKK